MRTTPTRGLIGGIRKDYDREMRKQVVMLLSGTPFERLARSTYNAFRDRVPARFVRPDEAMARIYDQLTVEIAGRALSNGGNSVDVGAHCGSILKALIKLSPTGLHWAFEPIPNLAMQLRKRFPNVTVEQLALSDYTGSANFRFLPGAAAYSSLLTRPEVEVGQVVRELCVEVRRLDDLIPEEVAIAFIKVDVEGGEAGVLRGAAQLLQRHKPVVVFECAPAKLVHCIPTLEDAGLRVSLLADFVAGRRMPLSDVMRVGREAGEFYYVASRS
jgi:FkbM family methyltransferase